MNSGGYAVWISLASLAVSMSTGVWSVVSWRRAGSRLRVHALLYREVLLLWVFNAGRIGDRVEEVVIGGRRGGIGGWPLTSTIGGGFFLAPGEARRIQLDWKTIIPESRHDLLQGGFESVWLLLGSMQQKRAEVLALPAKRPPQVGWRLAPRGANTVRYLPLVLGAPTLLISDLSRSHPTGAATVGTGLFLALAAWTMLTTGFRSVRRKVEQRYMLLGMLAFVVLAVVKASWMASGYPVALYLLGALVMGMPGWLSAGIEASRQAWRSHTKSTPGEAEDGAPSTPVGRAPAEPAP